MRLAFPRAHLLACTRHLKENTKRHLQDEGVCKKVRKDIINKIYGKGGLTSQTDIADFDDMSANICDSAVGYGEFQTYFETKVSGPLKENLMAGYPKWTSNNVESMNHVLKQAVNWKPHQLPDLICKLQKIVETQAHDGRRAIVGRGDYTLQQSHARFRLTAEAWSNMSEGERSKHSLKTFVLNPRSKAVKSTNGKLTVTCNLRAGKKIGQRKRKRCARTVTPSKKACRSSRACGSNEYENSEAYSDGLASDEQF